MNARIALSFALAVGINSPVPAQVCNPNIRETSPTTQFVIDTKKGTVLDTKTGLMWKHCAEGLSGTDCAIGSFETLDWIGALNRAADSNYAGHKDWRLPNVKELQTLVEFKCIYPAINTSVFPNTPHATNLPSIMTWSASFDTYVSDNRRWGVTFWQGSTDVDYPGVPHAVRLVRGGR